MKRSKRALTMTAMIAAAMLTACHETVYGPPPEELYGPPPEDESYIEESVDPAETVYGPPEDLSYDSEVILPDIEITVTPELPAPLYGPPAEEYDVENNMEEDVYGPPADEFDPDENEPEVVYGPPEYFEESTEADD